MMDNEMDDKKMGGMQDMSDMLGEMKSMMEDMADSGDMSGMPKMMSMMGEMIGMMSKIMGGSIEKDKYMGMSDEEKDKMDEKEIMGRH